MNHQPHSRGLPVPEARATTPRVCHYCGRAGARLVRRPFGGGRCHVLEQCLHCHRNARGAGQWVGQAELPCPREDLPLLEERGPNRAAQPTLFGDS